jgi:uracil-DNA glycosylase
MGRVSLPVHSSWNSVLDSVAEDIDSILKKLAGSEITPERDKIFAACEMELQSVKCVIVGQDPYPTRGNAQGLAFSVSSDINPLPASLKNIFTELVSDLGVPYPQNGDLSPWRSEGVLLLNRVLTTEVGVSNSHTHLGWQSVTRKIAEAAARQGAVAILWGKSAQELSDLFQARVESVHPSPLSAYRGFFGSKPFSQVNAILKARGDSPINWSL